jgi:Uma2 family endonuclease
MEAAGALPDTIPLDEGIQTELIETLGHRFRDDPLFYASGNLFVYFEKGHPEMVVAPDVFVARGVRKGKRRIYKIWEEKKGPDLVIELTSRDTHLEDLGKKRAIYERLRVKEYISPASRRP